MPDTTAAWYCVSVDELEEQAATVNASAAGTGDHRDGRIEILIRGIGD
ncbi:MAG TPA: hypothetical protein VHO67_06370 [Polyangia bacterium]|nr:hypothetical protein [Polyangia bacterium]